MCAGSRVRSLANHAPLRVAFTNIPRRIWAGGHNYQNNLFALLNRYCPGEVRPVMFAGLGDDATDLAAIAQRPPSRRPRGRTSVRARPRGSGGISSQPHRCRIRIRTFFWLAPTVSGDRLVSRFSVPPLAALLFARHPLAPRTRLSRPDRCRPDDPAEQRKRATRFPQILFRIDRRHFGGAVCDLAGGKCSVRRSGSRHGPI
jgi:hypothetical protein